MVFGGAIKCTDFNTRNIIPSLQYISSVYVLISLLCVQNTLQDGSITPLNPTEKILEVSMPNVRPTQDDDYLCSFLNIESYGTQYIHAFEPNANADRAHHMLLYTCDDLPEDLLKVGWWECLHHMRGCNTQSIIYAWAKNAAPTILPNDVGFRIGPEHGIKNLVLQVHYAHPLPEGTGDSSGFRIRTSSIEPRYLAGIFLLLRGELDIYPYREKIHGDTNCPLEATAPIHPFAYRTHTHKLGVVVSGYYSSPDRPNFKLIGKGNPQWPQAFYPIQTNITINPGDFVAARCTYSTRNYGKYTNIGGTAGDEMCNLYIMYYTESRNPEDHHLACSGETYSEVTPYLPEDSDIPLPRNITLEQHAIGHDLVSQPLTPKILKNLNQKPTFEYNSQTRHQTYPNLVQVAQQPSKPPEYTQISTWPDPSIVFGQVSGVTMDPQGNIVVFHRADRQWNSFRMFDVNNRYQNVNQGPIKYDTVYVIHRVSGRLLNSWGRDIFYMPHGITVDKQGNYWMTDVALHQVLKFAPGQYHPSLVLGQRFEPGNDDFHFCKPTSVAVMTNGDFFVGDGYCNSRIVRFNSRGERLFQWGIPVDQRMPYYPPPYAFENPHGLALAEERDVLCVADRENARIQCFAASSGQFKFQVRSEEFGGALFSVAYSPMDGGTLFAVNGPGSYRLQYAFQVFVIPLATRQIRASFKPREGFGIPHAIAISQSGEEVYVSDIAKPFKVWKFTRHQNKDFRQRLSIPLQPNEMGPGFVQKEIQDHVPVPAFIPQNKHQELLGLNTLNKSIFEEWDRNLPIFVQEESFGASLLIVAFFGIPFFLLIGVALVTRLRKSDVDIKGFCRRKGVKSLAEIFTNKQSNFEKLKMDESEGDNSDSEIDEYDATKQRKSVNSELVSL